MALIISVTVVANFQPTVAPVQIQTATNSTTTVQETAYKQVADVWVNFGPHPYGTFNNGTLTVVVNGTGPAANASAMTANLTIKVNSNVIAPATGSNTSGTKYFPLTAAMLVNGMNNVSYYVSNTSDVSSTTISFAYLTPEGVRAGGILDQTIAGYTTLGTWLPIIVIAIIGIFILVLVMTQFGGGKSSR